MSICSLRLFTPPNICLHTLPHFKFLEISLNPEGVVDCIDLLIKVHTRPRNLNIGLSTTIDLSEKMFQYSFNTDIWILSHYQQHNEPSVLNIVGHDLYMDSRKPLAYTDLRLPGHGRCGRHAMIIPTEKDDIHCNNVMY